MALPSRLQRRRTKRQAPTCKRRTRTIEHEVKKKKIIRSNEIKKRVRVLTFDSPTPPEPSAGEEAKEPASKQRMTRTRSTVRPTASGGGGRNDKSTTHMDMVHRRRRTGGGGKGGRRGRTSGRRGVEVTRAGAGPTGRRAQGQWRRVGGGLDEI